MVAADAALAAMTGAAHMNAVEIEQAIGHRPGQPAV